MRFMEASKENTKTVNKIIKLLYKRGYTVDQGKAVLDFANRRLEIISKVGYEKFKLK